MVSSGLQVKANISWSEISGSHDGDYEDDSFMGHSFM
jgi:hypothetical protein